MKYWRRDTVQGARSWWIRSCIDNEMIHTIQVLAPISIPIAFYQASLVFFVDKIIALHVIEIQLWVRYCLRNQIYLKYGQLAFDRCSYPFSLILLLSSTFHLYLNRAGKGTGSYPGLGVGTLDRLYGCKLIHSTTTKKQRLKINSNILW